MAAGSTLIIYGGMTLFNVQTKFCSQEIMRDESDTDPIGFKFTYSCIAHVHGMPSALTGILPTTGDRDAANAMVGLRYLFADRQHFELRMGVTTDAFGNISSSSPGTRMIVCDPANQAGSTDVNLKDINNGPKAKLMNISHVVGDTILQVEVEFEICMIQCFPNGTTTNTGGVLNNRWAVVDDINHNFMTTRTFTGKLRLSSAQVNPHSFRSLVLPSLQVGMRREHIQMAASEDGLTLFYSVVDKEIAFAPPKPATSGSFRFEEEVAIDGQIGFYSTADITLQGDRYVDHKVLISIATSMAIAKFSNGVKLAKDDTYIVQSISIIDEWSNDFNGIHLRAVARRVDTQGPAILGMPSKFLGVPITGNKIADVAADFDYRLSRGSRPGETTETSGPISVMAAFSSYLQGPCQIDHSIANGLPAQKGQPIPAAPATVVSYVVNKDIADDKTITAVYGSDNSGGMYTYWQMDVDDVVDTHRAQCPIAATAASSSGSSSSGASLGDAWWNGSPPPITTPTSVIVNLAPPTTTRQTTASGERVGAPPVMPKAQDYTDANGQSWKVAGIVSSTQSPRYTADGKKIYRKEVTIDWFCAGVTYAGIFAGVAPLMTFSPWAKERLSPVKEPTEKANP